ncbi:MAG: RimK family alpha-L-glutamate ligase [Candidatus Competibacterales bacterium]
MSKIHVIHENGVWTAPLFRALEAQGLPHADWDLSTGSIDVAQTPPEGVFYNRMSASAHSRGHRYAPEFTAAVLAWLEGHDRRVLNNSRALALEINKVAQYSALGALGIRTPRTIAASDRASLLKAAQGFEGAFITKHNRAGKGLGVYLFQNAAELQAYVDGPGFEPPVDGITLLQDYIQAPQPYITRVEFIGREFLYAVRVDTSQGFQLCPADACAVPDASVKAPEGPRFVIYETFGHSLLERYQRFMAANGMEVAAFEFIVDAQGGALK